MKFVVSSLTDIPEALRGEYEERGGKFYLKVEGDYAPLIEANTKLAEFRDNNRALNSTKTELENKLKAFEGIDPVEHGKLKTRIGELEKKGVKDGVDVADLVRQAVKAAVEPLEGKLRAQEEAATIAQAELARKGLEGTLREVGMKVGVDERALRDYIGRGMEVFKLVDGKATAMNGETPLFSPTKPADPLSMEEWAKSLQTDAPHLFKPSKGGGAGGGGNRQPEQRRVISSDPIEFGQNLEAIAKGEISIQQ